MWLHLLAGLLWVALVVGVIVVILLRLRPPLDGDDVEVDERPRARRRLSGKAVLVGALLLFGLARLAVVLPQILGRR